MPSHSAGAIANEFIRRAKAEARPLTNMQLQKLPFIAHGWSLALLNHPLVADVPVTFQYGPVYRKLYDALKRYGSGQVSDFVRENDGTAQEHFGASRGEPVFAELTENEKKLLDAVWEAYKGYNAFQLSDLTHQAKSPWAQTIQNEGIYCAIPNDLLKQHYQELAQQRRAG